MAEHAYAQRFRHPSGALDPSREKKSVGLSWWWFILASIAALILVSIYRPQWLEKIVIHMPRGGGGMLPPANPMGWV